MISIELNKQLRRAQTLVLLALVAALPAVLTIAFKVRGTPDHAEGPGGGFVDLATNSGLNMALVSLGHVGPLVLPIIVAVFAGSAIAEEAGWRTLGYLLLRPVPPGRFLASKIIVVVLLIGAAMMLSLLVAVVAGLIGFGWEPVDTPDGTTIATDAALLRVMFAMLYLAWGMAAILSVSIFVSTTTNAPLNAVASGFGIVIVSQLLDSVSAFGSARNVLPTHYWSAWEDLFVAPTSWEGMLAGSLIQLPYAIVFLGLAWWWFARKDILS